MQDFIEEVYKYARLTSALREAAKYSREELSFEVKQVWSSIQQTIMDLCVQLTSQGNPKGKELFNCITEACVNVSDTIGDYSKFADLVESAIPIIFDCMSYISDFDITEGNYRLFSSKSGYLTLENTKIPKTFHSTYDPMWEAYERAQVEYSPEILTYRILGCGLGYLPYQIYYASHGSADIEIYHNDRTIVDYAMDFGVLSMIPENKLKIIIDPDADSLLLRYTSDTKGHTAHLILHDGICGFSAEQAEKIFELDTLNRTRIHIAKLRDINFYRNAYNVLKVANQFVPKTRSDEWLLVAGGPSVDAQIDYIRSCVGKKVIVCASTILKSLLGNGIEPDCVVVLDPHDRTFGHFKNIGTANIPLVMCATANWQFSEYYGGDKYLISAIGDKKTSDYFEKLGQESWFLGTTVSTMLFELAIHKGAKKIDFVGVDLSYPRGESHAANTMDHTKVDTDGMIEVPSVNGETVGSTSQFMIYFREIQKIILENRNIEFINYSINGIRFEGTKWYKEV